ncbi:MAG: hypothetical protein ABI456_07985 [Ktedonobacteraceae bacterium]
MNRKLILYDDPLPETDATITLDILSDVETENWRGTKLPQRKEREGKITFNPDSWLIFSLPPSDAATSQVMVPDRTQWDLYLVDLSFTLHKPRDGRSYEEMTFFVQMAEHGATAFNLFPKDITTDRATESAYTVSPQCTISPVKAQRDSTTCEIHFTSLRPTISAFGEGESAFYWIYEAVQEQKGIEIGTQHALAILQVPRGISSIAATISYEVIMTRKIVGMWQYNDAKTDHRTILLDLSKARPFCEPEQPQAEPAHIHQNISIADTRRFDVCVVCALAKEAKAFLDQVSLRCEVQFQRAFHQGLKLDYYHTTISNSKGERLTLQVSWLPGNGPVETSLHLKPLFETFRPWFSAMTGICAGDKERVKLGDVIVAERAYFYDSGKFVINKEGKRGHLHGSDVYHVNTKVRSFQRMFDIRNVVATPPELVCHIGSMASGSAVRGDHPFKTVGFQLRDTLAIDMEGATFYRVAEEFPEMSALLVKGVSDYADGEKNDLYHWQAATVSAMYMLAFIEEFVTEDRISGN